MEALPVLCVLGVLCSLALAVDKTIPPEDLDGSADDEDFSGDDGSGLDGSIVNLESKDVAVHSTSVSALVPTVEGSTAAQEPEIVDEEETKIEVTTKSAETTKAHHDLIEDLFAVDPVAKEAATQEATTSPSQQTSSADLIEEVDTKKHHHHHHHHHPHHHHTTTSSTSVPPESDGHDTADIPPEVGKTHGNTAAPDDDESELRHQGSTTPAEHLVEQGGLLEETTSSSTTLYADNEKVAVNAIDADYPPDSNTLATSTVAEESHIKDHHPHHHHHHHHHHHPHHQTTTSSMDGSDVQQETTTASDIIEPEDNLQEEPTVAVEEDKPLHHGHLDHNPQRETTASTPESTEPEKPHEVHTHEPKGRKIHVPDVRSTTAVPLINGDAEKDDFTSSTVVYNVSQSPSDDDLSDLEEGSSGPSDEELYFEKGNAPVVNEGRMIPESPSTDNGSNGASQGIMERKELLAGIIAGGVAGLVFAGFLVAFVLYRMKKKDEGSYSLEEPKQSNGGYQKPREQREFYA